MVEPYKPLYTAKEVSKILRVNINTVYEYINSGQLTALKLGSIKVRGKDLEDFINRYPPTMEKVVSTENEFTG